MSKYKSRVATKPSNDDKQSSVLLVIISIALIISMVLHNSNLFAVGQ